MLKKRKREEEKKKGLHTGNGTIDGKETTSGEDTAGNEQKTPILESSTPTESALVVDTEERVEETKESTPISDSRATAVATVSETGPLEDQKNDGEIQTEKPVIIGNK